MKLLFKKIVPGRQLPSVVLLATLISVGCNPATSTSGPVEELKKAHEQMKVASDEFLTALTGVVDEKSAIEASPKLKEASAKMVAAAKDLELAMATKSRSATAVKNEVEIFRSNQKDLVDAQVRRIKGIPEAEEVVKEFLAKIASR